MADGRLAPLREVVGVSWIHEEEDEVLFECGHSAKADSAALRGDRGLYGRCELCLRADSETRSPAP
jgi:hypothetical protein